MSFIRAKEIPPCSGRWYDYEVEDYQEGEHVQQRVIRYIGRCSGIGTTSSGGRVRSGTHDVSPVIGTTTKEVTDCCASTVILRAVSGGRVHTN